MPIYEILKKSIKDNIILYIPVICYNNNKVDEIIPVRTTY